MRGREGILMPISHRTINYISKVLENGYTRERIEIVFRTIGVPEEILKLGGGKFVYSTKVINTLNSSPDPKLQKIVLDIAEEALKGELTNPPIFLGSDYVDSKKELEKALKLDGYELRSGKLVLYSEEEIVKEESILEKKLNQLGLSEANVYLEQSYSNYVQGKWEAANGSTRKFLEFVIQDSIDQRLTLLKLYTDSSLLSFPI